MSARVVILGTSGFAIELAALLEDGPVPLAGFAGPEVQIPLPAPYLGPDAAVGTLPADIEFLIAVGDPGVRAALIRRLRESSRALARFVHPSAIVASSAILGPGVLVYPNSTVHARVQLGAGTLINSNASIGHETFISDCVNISPGVMLGGRCRVGARAHLGIGCSVMEKITVCDDAVIGAGAVVVRDIQSPGTYVGVPAHKLER
jgi:sugar O-acyltransferase (sialic acid O-acetyltransferase NeuD family)